MLNFDTIIKESQEILFKKSRLTSSGLDSYIDVCVKGEVYRHAFYDERYQSFHKR